MATGAAASYVFSQKPRAVQRKKYRDMLDTKANLMSDKRVVRGNTYAARPLLPAQDQPNRMQSTRFAKTNIYARKRAPRRRQQQQEEPEEIPSHEYLEELTDIAIAEDFATQTDRGEYDADDVPFIPKARGEDKLTWIDELEMFDFESSVEPILEVLIGKSMDQGLLEVSQEEEIKVLKAHRLRWEQKRGIVHTEAQRLLTEAQRFKEEADRRIAQDKEADLMKEIEAHNRRARKTAKEFYESLQETIITRLEQAGHFYDPVLNQVENVFMPWLLEKVNQRVGEVQNSRDEVDELVAKSITEICIQVAEAKEKKRQEQERLQQEAAADRKRVEEMMERQRQDQEAQKMAAVAAEDQGEGDEEED